MEDQVQGQRSEVKKGGKETPVLIWLAMTRNGWFEAHLVLHKDRLETVEELKWRNDFALHERTCQNCCCRPPSCTKWHIPEPLLQWKSRLSTYAPITGSHHPVHYSPLGTKISVELSRVIAQAHLCTVRTKWFSVKFAVYLPVLVSRECMLGKAKGQVVNNDSWPLYYRSSCRTYQSNMVLWLMALNISRSLLSWTPQHEPQRPPVNNA